VAGNLKPWKPGQLKPWKPGQSGNPSGRPAAVAAVRDLARRHTTAAIKTLVEIMRSGKPDQARVAAASALLDRGYGKPLQALQTEGQVGRVIVNILEHPDPAPRPAEARGDRPMAPHAPVAALGDGLEPGEALRDEWLRRLPEDERHVLEVLIRAYPAAVALDVLSEATGFPGAVLDRYLNRLKCSHFVASEGRSAVRAARELVDA
jgi:hypothetical protein